MVTLFFVEEGEDLMEKARKVMKMIKTVLYQKRFKSGAEKEIEDIRTKLTSLLVKYSMINHL